MDQLHPDSAYTEKILYSVATYFDVGDDLIHAQEAYRRIAEKFPRGEYAERALWKVAIYDYFQNRYEQALNGFWNYLRNYHSLSSTSAGAYWLGRCYESLGDFVHAGSLYGHVCNAVVAI